jgi:hypothetical protein
MGKELEHGTEKAYTRGKCRCDLCRAAHNAYCTKNRRRRFDAPKDPNDPRHGTKIFYTSHGCRCDACFAAVSKAVTQFRGRMIKGSTEDRFWAKVDKTETCWNWTGSTTNGGYGMFKMGASPKVAHRISYTYANGEIPDGMTIDHMCHNRSCVNPDHLRIATTKENGENRKGASGGNISGVRGVSWHKPAQKWYARVGHNGKQYNVGLFDDLQEAEAAVIAKRLELFTHNDLDRAA